MKSKIFQQKNTSGNFERQIQSKDPKKCKVEVSSIVYNDFNPDLDDYEEQEIRIKKSKVNFKIKEVKGKSFIILVSADIEFDIDDGDQNERFMDKDWSEEWVVPTLKIVNGKKEEYIDYQDNSLFGLELVY